MKVAIIGAGIMAKNMAIRAKELNIATLCFAWAKGAVADKYADYFYDVNIFDTDKITEICKANDVNGILATTELTIKPAAVVAKALGLNTNPIEVAENITNKSWVRAKGSKFKYLKQPFFKKIIDFSEKNDDPIFPVIVKPASYGGKHGISVAHNHDEYEKALDFAKNAIGNRNSDGIIVEQFLEGGQEYSVESLSFHGKHHIIQVTQKDSSGAPHCVELGHHQPAAISAEMRCSVEKALIDMLNCVGLENGPAHTEIKIINNEIYLIEINARPGGDRITYPLTELSSGYKYLTGIILTACDIHFDPEVYTGEKRHAGIYFITKQTEHLLPLFENCEGKDWLYEKNKASEELQEITHNDSTHTNSIIYCSSKKISLEDI